MWLVAIVYFWALRLYKANLYHYTKSSHNWIGQRRLPEFDWVRSVPMPQYPLPTYIISGGQLLRRRFGGKWEVLT